MFYAPLDISFIHLRGISVEEAMLTVAHSFTFGGVAVQVTSFGVRVFWFCVWALLWASDNLKVARAPWSKT